MESNLCTLEVGGSINIKRSDGRVHPALVTTIDYNLNVVRVEWFEDNETKGKEIDFESIISLNSGIIIINEPERRIKRRSSPDIAASAANVSQRKRSAALPVTVHTRSRSARSRLTQNSPFRNRVTEDQGDGLLVRGRRIQSSKSSADPSQQRGVLKEVGKLEKNRIERRQRQAETKAHIEEIMKLNQNSPYWKLQEMINNYCSRLKILPLSEDDLVEDHLITVCVRKRPLNEREFARKEVDIVTVTKKNQLIVHEPKNKVDLTKYLDNHVFNFDYVFNESCTNEVVYKYTAQPLIQTIFDGGFATCFAYGQTGSGKTYTMSGNLSQGNSENGIYALVVEDIFRLVDAVDYRSLSLMVSASFFEIYTKKVLDLLNNKATLKILEDGSQQVQVVGLTEKVVGSVAEVLKLIEEGNEARTSGQTSANTNSSRSHAVFQIYLRPSNNMTKIHGKFSLIDLAGNERGADTSSSDKLTRMEGAEINKSLLALKECIRALGRKGAHLPFRVSKLTQVLRDSFVGCNSRTCMIAMVSPNVGSCEHTLNTLRYADRVKELGGSETHINPLAEQTIPDVSFNGGLICIEESLELSDSSATALNSPNDLEFRVAERKILDNHVETMKILVKATEDGKNLIEAAENGTVNPQIYYRNWEGVVDNCLGYLLIAKEIIMSHKEQLDNHTQV